MQCFASKGQGRTYLVVLDKGELLLEGIQEAVRKEGIKSAVITGGIGSLTNCNSHVITVTGLPPKDERIAAKGAIELASVQGSVVDGDPHVHIIAWNWDTKETYVGHLEEGCEVCYRVEISMQALEGVNIERVYDPSGMIWIREAAE
jgi:predicted DNA-binding protein with PD1-like motif